MKHSAAFKNILFMSIFLSLTHSLSAQEKCQRIVSLAPSVTETVFAVGLADRLVGITTFCDYPEAARKLPQLGSYFDTNIEKALAIKTDLVIGLPESKHVLQKFSAYNIPVLKISNRSIEQILFSFTAICDKCGCQSKALELKENIELQLKKIRQAASLRSRQKAAVLIVSSVGRKQNEFYLSGNDGYYSSLLAALNISNVVSTNTFALPGASFETLIALSPDILFTVSNRSEESKIVQRRIQTYLPKAKIIELYQDYASKPGPRFIDLLEYMQEQSDRK